jgi:hypothetical protein
MAVRTVWTERQYNVWSDAADEWHDFALRHQRIGVVEVAIDVIEKMNLADAQFSGGRTQFRLTYLTYNFK